MNETVVMRNIKLVAESLAVKLSWAFLIFYVQDVAGFDHLYY